MVNEVAISELTKEELARLVDYFELLIQMDHEQNQKIKQDEGQ